MALDYDRITANNPPIYNAMAGVAPSPSFIMKDSSMNIANPSNAKSLYSSRQDSPFYNPEVISSYPIPVKTIPLKYPLNKPLENPKVISKPTIIYQKEFSTPSNNNLYLWLSVFLIFVLIMSKK